MNVRDAREADAERLAALADAPAEAMGNLVHDRTVRVVETDGEVRGFVSFDARREAVHVTQVGGPPDVAERLLGEPVRFAATEGMAVELLVEVDREALRAAALDAGFEKRGRGPRFDGAPTVAFRYDP